MSRSPPLKLDLLCSIPNFGALLRYLRQRLQLTQRELALATGYSFSQISRLEQNQRLPDEMTLLAVFVPALGLEQEPATIDRLLALARQARTGAAASPATSEASHDRAASVTRGERLTAAGHNPQQALETGKQSTPAQPPQSSLLLSQVDWGEAPDVSGFTGRQAELTQVQHWLVAERCRLVAVLGMGGLGKTALATRLATQMEHAFAAVVWRYTGCASGYANCIAGICYLKFI